MLACVDAHYPGRGAIAACLLFRDFSDAEPSERLVARIGEVEPYAPGELYLRELPCLLAVLARVRQPLEVVLIDGYVWLGPERPGLGAHLHRALGGRAAVIGVAKTRFRDAPAAAVRRGKSERPLYVTAIGTDLGEAAARVRAMHGAHRIPTLLREVDRLARTGG